MTRQELLTYLTHTFDTIGTELSITWSDTPGGVDNVIDSAMEALGSNTSNADTRALGDYFFLQLALRKASTQTDFETTGIRVTKRSQLYNQIEGLFETAEKTVKRKGLLDEEDDLAFDIAYMLPESYRYGLVG